MDLDARPNDYLQSGGQFEARARSGISCTYPSTALSTAVSNEEIRRSLMSCIKKDPVGAKRC